MALNRRERKGLCIDMIEWNSFSNPPTQRATLLVVTSDDMLPALAPFADHKARVGVPCVVASMTMIRRDVQGADDAERVKQLIYYAFTNMKTRYVMIAGDAAEDHVPVRYRFVRQPAGTTLDATYNPTDHYYADLLGDDDGAFNKWDNPSAPDRRYNEQLWLTSAYTYNPDGVKGRPDVVVARVPAHTVDELRTYVQKVIAYETEELSGTGWAAFFANADYSPNVCAIAEGIVAGMGDAPGFAKLRFGLHFDNMPPNQSGWVRGTVDDLTRAFEAADWISYLGHGAPRQWASCITFDSASRMPNRRRFPVVMSSGCETGAFAPYITWNVRYRDVRGQAHCMVDSGIAATPVRDAVDGSLHAAPYELPLPAPYDVDAPAGGRCMASAFLFARTPDGSPSGGIAYMGESLALQPTSADEFQAAALKAYHQDGLCLLGDVWLRAQLALWSSNKNSGHTDTNFDPPRIYLSIMHLFGDPTLRIRRIHRLIWKNSSGLLSVWNVDDAGRQVTYKEHPTPAGWTPVNASRNRILWSHTTGRISLWRLNDLGEQTLFSECGPFAGWRAVHCTEEWLLWVNQAERISLWRLTDHGHQASYKEHDAPPDCKVVNCCRTMILWRRADGAAVVWRIDPDGNKVREETHGPCIGWTPDRVEDGHLLWRGAAGRISLWTLDDACKQTSYAEHAPAGWTATVLTSGRLLWRQNDGRLALWHVGAEATPFDFHEYAPISGWDLFTYAE